MCSGVNWPSRRIWRGIEVIEPSYLDAVLVVVVLPPRKVLVVQMSETFLVPEGTETAIRMGSSIIERKYHDEGLKQNYAFK